MGSKRRFLSLVGISFFAATFMGAPFSAAAIFTSQQPVNITPPHPIDEVPKQPSLLGAKQQADTEKEPSQVKPAEKSALNNRTEHLNITYDEESPPNSNCSPLNVVDALNNALIESPRAAAIRAQFGITQAGYAGVTEVPNPIFFLDRGLVAEQESRLGPILTEEPPWKLFFRFLAQKRSMNQSEFDLMTKLWQLRSDVRRAYTEVVVAQETLKALDELYNLSAKLEAVASKRFQAGDVPELDVLKARLATSQTRVDRVVGIQRVIRARQQLNIIMGKAVDDPINVLELPDYTSGDKANLQAQKSDVLPDFSQCVEPLALYESRAENNRLELKSLREQIKLNQTLIESAYGNVIPNPSIALGKSSAGNVPTGPKVVAVFFTINSSMPMTNTNQGNIGLYKATAKQLRFQVAAVRNQIATDVSSAYQNLLAARGKLQAYQAHVLADSFEVAHLARRSYEVGQIDITATLAAQQANVQTRSAYLDAVSSYQTSFTDLEQACGEPL
jgi:outer membrane protein, heavy metal efflux system